MPFSGTATASYVKTAMGQTNSLLQVMLVDDDRVNNMLTRRAFKKAGIQADFQEFLHAPEAIGWLEKQEVSLSWIFLDINMPGMNGWEFLEAYHNKGLKIPVIMLTTSIDEEDRARALEWEQVAAFLEKPLRIEDLKRCLGL